MKKHISLLSLTTAIVLQSCERTESLSVPDTIEQKQESIETLKNRKSATNAEEPSSSNKFETGDDDEPKRDKQHWRMAQDTIW